MMAKKEGRMESKWKGIALGGKEELQRFVTHSEWNFRHKLQLLEAEIAFRLDADYDTASKTYDDAIETAKRHSFLNETALAYERAAMFLRRNWQRHQGTRILRISPQRLH